MRVCFGNKELVKMNTARSYLDKAFYEAGLSVPKIKHLSNNCSKSVLTHNFKRRGRALPCYLTCPKTKNFNTIFPESHILK